MVKTHYFYQGKEIKEHLFFDLLNEAEENYELLEVYCICEDCGKILPIYSPLCSCLRED